MEKKNVTILTGAPTVAPIAQMELMQSGIEDMVDWVRTHRPECLPEELANDSEKTSALFPHSLSEPNKITRDMRELTSNELLVELAGRKCYDSFGLKAGKKSNKEYIEHTQSGDVKHMSILYHAKISFFFAGISRRVSHEIIRNYVGTDRSEEGNPSQESTRFTHHYGFFIEPPKYSNPEYGGASHLRRMKDHFSTSMQSAYDNYLEAVALECAVFEELYGRVPTSIDKKRIYEAASSFLPHQAETSFIWTTNPAAISKLCFERDNAAADLEIQRFAQTLKSVSVNKWPNLFPQPFMQEARR